MALDCLQRTIETIYRIEGPVPVCDYRIDGNYLDVLLGDGAASKQRETLIVHQDDEYTNLALYIEDTVVLRASVFLETCGTLDVCDAPLDDFCVATEGVSHFVYFTFCGARLERPVSRIELELQAEIDKFLVLRALRPVENSRTLERLFDAFALAPHLSRDEGERYVAANSAARRYARWLAREFERGRGDAALRDARTFYRKPFSAKLEHIARAA